MNDTSKLGWEDDEMMGLKFGGSNSKIREIIGK